MSAWENELTLKFIELYQRERCLWNPADKSRKDKKKVADAWTRISNALDKPVTELKRKKEGLMASFRSHLKKKKASMRSGAEEDDIYQPIWFAYNAMEVFLEPVYKSENPFETENVPSFPAPIRAKREIEEIDVLAEDNTNESTYFTTSAAIPSSSTPKHRRPSLDLAERRMVKTFKSLTNILKRKQQDSEDDECELYGKLLAMKLRKLPDSERDILMFDIDTLFIKRYKQHALSLSNPSQASKRHLPSSSPHSSNNSDFS